ncbi:hypothetical protein SFRURICE_004810, partial [Spodoptera frugiperda]
ICLPFSPFVLKDPWYKGCAYCHIPATIPDSVLLLRNFRNPQNPHLMLSAHWLPNYLFKYDVIRSPDNLVHGRRKNACYLKEFLPYSQIFNDNTDIKSLIANRKLLKANPPLTSVTGDPHGAQCVKTKISHLPYSLKYQFTKVPVHIT